MMGTSVDAPHYGVVQMCQPGLSISRYGSNYFEVFKPPFFANLLIGRHAILTMATIFRESEHESLMIV